MNNQSVKQDYSPKKENPFKEYFKIPEDDQNLMQTSTNFFSDKYRDKILGERDKEDLKETALETKLNQQLKGKDFKRRSSKFLSSKEIKKIDNIRDSLNNIGVLSTKDNEEYLTIRKMPNIKEEQYYEMQNKIVDQKMLTNLYDYLKNINCNFKSQASGDSVGGISPLSFLIECFYGPNKEKNKEKKDKYKLLQTYIYNYRTISGDGNCYYRAVMFRYLEILILSNNIEFLRKLVYDIVQSFKSEELQKRKIILNSDIKPDLTFKILFLIVDLLKNNMINEALQILVKCFCTCKKFDYAIILYFRYILYDYIKKNENKIYLKSFPIKIGNLLPSQYETESGKFLFNSFYENYLLKFFVDAEKIIIYLTPFVLGMELNIVIFDINDEDNLQKFLWEGESEIKKGNVISLLNSRNHYEIIYSKNDNEKYKNYFEIYENHIESKKFLENDISIKKNEEEEEDEFKLLASTNKNLKAPKTVVGTKKVNNILNNNNIQNNANNNVINRDTNIKRNSREINNKNNNERKYSNNNNNYNTNNNNNLNSNLQQKNNSNNIHNNDKIVNNKINNNLINNSNVNNNNKNNLGNNNAQNINNNNSNNADMINNIYHNNPTTIIKINSNLKNNKSNRNKDNNVAHNNDLANNDINIKNKTNIVKNKYHDNKIRDIQKNNNNEKINEHHEKNRLNQVNPKTNPNQQNKANNKNNLINIKDELNPEKKIIKKNKNILDINKNNNRNKNDNMASITPQGNIDINSQNNYYSNTPNSNLYNINCQLCKEKVSLKNKNLPYCQSCLKRRLFMYYINSIQEDRDPYDFLLKEKNLKERIEINNINFKEKLDFKLIENNIKNRECLFCDKEVNKGKYKLPCKNCNLCEHFTIYFEKDYNFEKSFKCKCRHNYNRIDMIKLGLLYYEKNKEITKKIIDPYFKIRAPKTCCICNLEKNEFHPINHTLKVIEFKGHDINEENLNEFINKFKHFCCENCKKNEKYKTAFSCKICLINHIITN